MSRGELSFADGLVTVQLNGVSCHAQAPQDGVNAATHLFDWIGQCFGDSAAAHIAALFSDNLGNGCGLAFTADDPPYFEDRIAIVGHTPTCYMSGDMESPFAIWHGNGLIDIDCGCGNKTELRRLACLRLDDLKEFYI